MKCWWLSETRFWNLYSVCGPGGGLHSPSGFLVYGPNVYNCENAAIRHWYALAGFLFLLVFLDVTCF